MHTVRVHVPETQPALLLSIPLVNAAGDRLAGPPFTRPDAAALDARPTVPVVVNVGDLRGGGGGGTFGPGPLVPPRFGGGGGGCMPLRPVDGLCLSPSEVVSKLS